MIFLQYFIPVLLILVKAGVNVSPKCDPGWFGENCRYLCQCLNRSDCSDNGTCLNTTCLPSTFGPGCQYTDGAIDSLTPMTYLIDHDDETCNNASTAASVELLLPTPTPFMWFRVTFRDKAIDRNFTARLNGNTTCTNERKFIGLTFVDVTCDTAILLQRLTIKGPIARDICSIYISTGRQVARKQNAIQSTNNTRMPSYGAELAVDGNVNVSGDSCSSAQPGKSPLWELNYNRPQMLIRLDVYSDDSVLNILNGFTVTAMFNNDTIYNASHGAVDPSAHYFINLAARTATNGIQIRLKTDTSNGILSLCEVETYGETLCREGTYGLWCSENCECNDTEICSLVTGLCAPGCPPGFYGFNCASPCSRNCLLCGHREGRCLKCEVGYKGKNCDKRCDQGFFGPQCNSSCAHCLDHNCHHITGKCLSLNGTNVTGCEIGYYGDKCTLNCPDRCKELACRMVTGVCYSCHPRLAGLFCETCADKYYGSECEMNCSKFCEHGSCDSFTGFCMECSDHYTGPLCDMAPLAKLHGETRPDSNKWTVLVIFCGFIMTMSVVLLFCVKRGTVDRQLHEARLE